MMELNTWTLSTAIPLVLCSVVALALILERVVFYRKQKRLNRQSFLEFERLVSAGNVHAALEQISKQKIFYGSTIPIVKQFMSAKKELRDEAIEIELEIAIRLLRKNFSGMLTVASLAPMAGLFGTVVGLMRSFHSIGLKTGPVEPSIIADGLWQALATTAAGLVIGGVCIFAHAVFASKSRRYAHEANVVFNKLSIAIASEAGA